MRHLHKLGEKKSHTGSLETAHTHLQSLEELRKWKLESSKVTIFLITERHCTPEVKSNRRNKREYFGPREDWRGVERENEFGSLSEQVWND